MPTRKTGVTARIDVLEKTLIDTERILFDPVIERALMHVMRVDAKKFQFACQDLLTKRSLLQEASKARIPHATKRKED